MTSNFSHRNKTFFWKLFLLFLHLLVLAFWKNIISTNEFFSPRKIPSLALLRIVLSSSWPFWWQVIALFLMEFRICNLSSPKMEMGACVWRRQEGDETSIMESILLIENARDKVWRNNIRRTMLLGGFFFF